jgi:hypothetical protein
MGVKHQKRASAEIERLVSEELRRAAIGGRISCRTAMTVAEKLGVMPILVGRLADVNKIRITDCQLGCFGHGRARKPEGAGD